VNKVYKDVTDTLFTSSYRCGLTREQINMEAA
jgi:hypothetical protein